MVNVSIHEEDEESIYLDSKKRRVSFPRTTKEEDEEAEVKEEEEEEENGGGEEGEEKEEGNSEGGEGEEEEEENDGGEREEGNSEGGEGEEEEGENSEGGEGEEEEEENSEGEEGREEGDQEEHIEASGVLSLEKNAGFLGRAGEGSVSVTLTDPEVLDCPICFETLTIPVFQCANGHIACSTCRTKMRRIGCPSCDTPIGSNRCMAVEKVLESITVSCKNRNYGCIDSPLYIARHKHEEVCAYTPCSCPFSGCSFEDSWKQLSEHIIYKHGARHFKYGQSICFSLGTNQRFVIFHEDRDGFLFILNNTKERLGNVVSVSRIGPPTTESYCYKLAARVRENSIRLQYSTNNSIQKWVVNLPSDSDSFLLIPCHFVIPHLGMRYKMELCISASGVVG